MHVVFNIFSKIAKRITTFFHKMKHFGFQIAFWDLLDSQKHKIRIFYSTINNNKHNAVINWLSKNFSNFITEYTNSAKTTQPQSPIPKKIWICWWDGIDTMPLLVKACYNSVLQYASDYKVTVITKDNFSNYISIPDHVLQKVKNKIMTVTHFSNIIRMSCLFLPCGVILAVKTFPNEDGQETVSEVCRNYFYLILYGNSFAHIGKSIMKCRIIFFMIIQ